MVGFAEFDHGFGMLFYLASVRVARSNQLNYICSCVREDSIGVVGAVVVSLVVEDASEKNEVRLACWFHATS
jgi:hypothetical protein